jgi:hypothetical protein
MSSKATPARITDFADRVPAVESETPSVKNQQEAASSAPVQFTHEECSQRAYSLWQQRGCPEGSAERDWLEAEEQLRSS